MKGPYLLERRELNCLFGKNHILFKAGLVNISLITEAVSYNSFAESGN